MWMSNIYIMVSQNNCDHNSLVDLCAAINETGAQIVSVDPENQLIEAATPSHEVPTIAAMEGVKYVRSIFTYITDSGRRIAA